MSGLISPRGNRVIYAGYSNSTANTTGGGVSPIFTDIIDTYNAGASGIYTFPRAMRARVCFTGVFVAIAASSNALLYPFQNGGLSMPTNYGYAYGVVATAGECQTLKSEMIWDFVAGNIIGPVYATTAGNARLTGDVGGASFFIEELRR